MAADLEIRIANAADRDALVRLAAAFRDQLERTTPSDTDLGHSIARLLKDPATDFVLACGASGAAVGYVQARYRYSAWLSALEAELEDVFVLEEERRRGTGRQLVAFAITRAAERGCRSIGLNTNEHNEGALVLYRHFGFRAERALWKAGRQLWLEKTLQI